MLRRQTQLTDAFYSIFIASILILLTGCQPIQYDDARKAAKAAVESPPSHMSTFGSKERMRITSAERMNRMYGKVSVSTKANPEGQTRIYLANCKHPNLGAGLDCKAYFYKISPEGWLTKHNVHLARTGAEKKAPSGRYFLKSQYSTNPNYYTAREVEFTPGVTNLVTITLE